MERFGNLGNIEVQLFVYLDLGVARSSSLGSLELFGGELSNANPGVWSSGSRAYRVRTYLTDEQMSKGDQVTV